MKPSWKRDGWLWMAFLIASVLALRSQLRGGSDMGIYLAAAAELREGGYDLYRAREGMGPYPYPHCFLLPIAALQWFLPDLVIRILWALGLGGAAALLFADLRRAAACLGGIASWRWFLLVALFGRCISQNLTHGQLSLWVAALMLHGVMRIVAGRPLVGGGFVGAATALKLTPALLLVLLPAMRQTRAMLSGIATLLVLVFLLPWPLLGTGEHTGHLRDFEAAMIAPLYTGERDPNVGTRMGPSASITGTFDYLLQERPRNADGRVLAIADVDDDTLGLIKAGYGALLLGVAALGFWRARRLPTASRLLLQSSLVMMAMVLFSPLSRVYHLAGILLPGLLFCALGPRRRDLLWWLASACLLIAMPLRQKSLLGRELWWILDQVGVLHLGLVALLLWLTIHGTGSLAARARERDE